MNMKYKQKVEFIESLFLLLVGIVLVLLPIYVEPKIEIVIRLIFALYAVINLVQYILTFKSKDIEGLITFFISLLAIGSTFLFNVSEPKGLAMSLMAWITLMSVAKLTKVDYYHDKKSSMCWNSGCRCNSRARYGLPRKRSAPPRKLNNFAQWRKCNDRFNQPEKIRC